MNALLRATVAMPGGTAYASLNGPARRRSGARPAPPSSAPTSRRKSHSWFAGVRGDLAVSVFIYGGEQSTTGAVVLAQNFFTALPPSADYRGGMTTKFMTARPSWVAEHIQRYVETDGAEGHIWRGVPTLLLTTTGRKSGELRRTALIYGEHGASYVIVASQGGAADAPGLVPEPEANPEVGSQVGADKFERPGPHGDRAGAAELWPMMAAIWPAYDEYQTKTDRQIPLVYSRAGRSASSARPVRSEQFRADRIRAPDRWAQYSSAVPTDAPARA